MKLIPIDGGHLAAWTVGEGPPVVFLHGGPGDTHHYMKRMAAPLFRDFQCIFFDQRGTGRSSLQRRSGDQFHIELLFDDLLAVQKHFSTGPTALVGHSWGAMYALFASLQLPEQISRAALISMGPLDGEMSRRTAEKLIEPLTSLEREEWIRLRADRNSARNRGDLETVKLRDVDMMKLRVKSWVFNPKLREAFLQEYFQDPPPDRDVNKWICESAENWFSWEKVRSGKVPTWICAGENDSVPLTQAERIREIMPSCSITVLERCGHIPWLEHPDLFYSSLTKFLQSPAGIPKQ